MKQKTKYLLFFPIIAAITIFIFRPITASTANMDARISDTAYAATVKYGKAYGICPELLQALIETESSGNPNAVNGGCIGLCQIYEKYHYGRMEKLGAWNLYDENSNILLAADYLAELFAEFKDVSLVLDTYNGNNRAGKNYEQGIISDYAGTILKRSAELERLHGK